MRHAAPAGFVAVPLAIFVGTVFAASAAARTAARGQVELELAGVLPMPEGSAGILVLREKGGQTIVPLVIPDAKRFARGGARDAGLIGAAIEALGARVAKVELEEPEESAAGAKVLLSRGGHRIEIRAAPSDSIALAVSAHVPIVASRKLVDEAGLTPADLARIHSRVGAQRAVRM